MSKFTLLQDTVIYSVMSWAQKLTLIIFNLLCIRYYSSSGIGYMALIFLVSNYLYSACFLGVVNHGLPKFISDSDQEYEKKEYITSSLFITIIGTTLFLIIFWTSLLLKLVKLNYNYNYNSFGISVTLMALGQIFWYTTYTVLRWTFRPMYLLKFDLLKSILPILFTSIGVICFGWSVQKSIIILSCLTILIGAYGILLIRNFLDISFINISKVKKLFAFSWPLFAYSFVYSLSLTINNLIVSQLTNLNEFGIFSIAVLIATSFDTLTSGILSASGTHFILNYKSTIVINRYIDCFNLTVILGLICLVFLGLWGEHLISFYKGTDMYSSIRLLVPWLILGNILYGLGANFFIGPYLMNKNHITLFVYLFTSMVNLATCLLLIPKLGLLGAGIGLALSGTLGSMIQFHFSSKLFFIHYKWIKSLIILSICTIFIFALEIFLQLNCRPQDLLGIKFVITIPILFLFAYPFYKDLSNCISGSIFKNHVDPINLK